MKKLKKILFIFSFLGLIALAACVETETDEPIEITGITFSDKTYEYDGEAKSIYITGDLPEGVSVTYTGNEKVDVGVYEVTASFTVSSKYKELADLTATLTITAPKSSDLPTVTGVVDGESYDGDVTPVFDKGTATLKKNDEEPVAFESGTKITEFGEYVLVVVNESEEVTITFTIKETYTVYENQVTDLFDNTMPHTSYIGDANLTYFIEDDMLVMENKINGDPWGILKREFKSVNATLFPYIEIKVDNVYDGSNVRLEVALTDDEWSDEPNILTITYSGIYYLNVLDYVTNHATLDETDADIFIKFAVVGKEPGYAGAVLDYYKSVSEIPPKDKADQYVDNTLDTLATWRTDTATLEIIDGEAVAFVTSSESYGKVLKRVILNTVDYDELIIDIDKVSGNASWSLKFTVEGESGDKTFIETDKAGIFKINLNNYPELRDKENVVVLFEFYVIGDGDDDYVYINGFKTVEYVDETLLDDFTEDDWDIALGTKDFMDDKFTLIKKENEDMAKASKFIMTSTMEYHHILLTFSSNFSLDDGFTVKVIDQSQDGWPSYDYKGRSHMISEIDNEDGTYSYEFLLDLTKQSAFINKESIELFFEIVIEYGDALKGVKFDSMILIDPDELDTGESLIIDSFNKDNWELGLGEVEFEKGNFKLIKKENEDMAKASKKLELTTTVFHQVVIELTSNFKLDAGFTVVVIDQSKDGWPRHDYKGNTDVLLETENGDGTYSYLFLIDLTKQEVFINQELTELFFEVVIEFGDPIKWVTLHEIRYLDLTIDDFRKDDWNVGEGIKQFEEGKLTISIEEGETMAKLSKSYDLNTISFKNVLVELSTNFKLDEAFEIAVIDTHKPGWPRHDYKGNTDVLTEIDHEDGTYSYLFLIDLSKQEVFINQENTNLFFEIVFQGDTVKTIELNSIKYY